MKLLEYILIAALLYLIYSCSNDDGQNNAITAEQAEQLESTPLKAKEVSSNAFIPRKTKFREIFRLKT